MISRVLSNCVAECAGDPEKCTNAEGVKKEAGESRICQKTSNAGDRSDS